MVSLFSGKSLKLLLPYVRLSGTNASKSNFGWGSPDPLAGLKGPTSKRMGGECCGVRKILEIDPGCCSTEAATTTMMSRTTSRMALQRISRVARGARRTNQSPRAAAAAGKLLLVRQHCRCTIATAQNGAFQTNNNNNSHDNVYGAVIMTSHCESLPGSFDECRLSAGWPPTLRPSQSTWAVSPPIIGSYHPHPLSPLLLLGLLSP